MTVITEKGQVIEIPARRSPLLRAAGLHQVQANLAHAFPVCVTAGCQRRAVVNDEYCFACAQGVESLRPIFAVEDGAWRDYAKWALRLWKRFELVILLAVIVGCLAWTFYEFLIYTDVQEWLGRIGHSLFWRK